MKFDKYTIIYTGAIGFILLTFLALLSFNIIGYSVKEKCLLAQERYDGDCIEALVTYLEDDQNSFRSRNSAVWALGQLQDERALPTLESFYSSYNGGHSSLDEEISQYELQKAINLINGFNITGFVWQGDI